MSWEDAVKEYGPPGTVVVESINEDEYVATYPLMFHWTMIRGLKCEAEFSYDDRWCYETQGLAVSAMYEWIGRGCEGDPVGWHRHPKTGRRRPQGNPEEEYVSF